MHLYLTENAFPGLSICCSRQLPRNSCVHKFTISKHTGFSTLAVWMTLSTVHVLRFGARLLSLASYIFLHDASKVKGRILGGCPLRGGKRWLMFPVKHKMHPSQQNSFQKIHANRSIFHTKHRLHGVYIATFYDTNSQKLPRKAQFTTM